MNASLASGNTFLTFNLKIKTIWYFRQKMEKTARSIEECEQRWVEIEYLMGFKITNSSSASGTRVVPGGALSG